MAYRRGDPLVATEIVQAVYAKLENKPGTLERATRAVAERRLNIDAVGVETWGGSGFVRLLTGRPRDAIEALRSAGFEAHASAMVVVTLPNRPGQLAAASRELAAAGINVEAVVGTPDGRLALRTSDVERAEAILRKLGP